MNTGLFKQAADKLRSSRQSDGTGVGYFPMAGGRSALVTPPPTQPSVLPTPKPHGALDVSSDGLPYYGDGFKGWVRKAWADLSDPKNFFQDKDKLTTAQIQKVENEYESEVLRIADNIEGATNWSSSKWGQRFFGISSKEIASTIAGGEAELDIAKLSGDSVFGTSAAASIRRGVSVMKSLFWGGLEILSATDTAVRKVHSARAGLDTLADKFDPDGKVGWAEFLPILGLAGLTKDVWTVAKAQSEGKLTWGDAKEHIQDFQKGSDMAYSMLFDEYATQKFEEGLANGEDPGFLAAEYGRTGIELAGSILGDPSTYLGLTLVKPVNIFSKSGRAAGNAMKFFGRDVKLFGIAQRLPWATIGTTPTGGELLSSAFPKLGKIGARAKILAEADRFSKPAINGLTELFEAAVKVPDAESKVILKQAAALMVDGFKGAPTELSRADEFKTFGSLFTPNAESKVKIASNEASFFLKLLVKDGMDTAAGTLRDLVRLRRGGADAMDAAMRIASRHDAAMLTSHSGILMADILTRLDDVNLTKILGEATNPQLAHAEVYSHLTRVLDEVLPSVDDMLKAKQKIKELPAGVEPSDRLRQLAKMADDVPAHIKAITALTAVPRAAAKSVTNFMVLNFLHFAPRGTMRNIYGNFIPYALRANLTSAIGAVLQAPAAFVKTGNVDLTDTITKNLSDDFVKRFGVLPDELSFTVGQSLKKGGFEVYGIKIPGFLGAMSRSESIMSNRLMLDVGTEELKKMLPAVLEDPIYKNWVATLPTEQQGLISHALMRSYGDFDEAINTVKEWTKTGKIEAWRLSAPSARLERELRKAGMLEAFYAIQAKATDPKMFVDEVGKIVKEYDDMVKQSAKGIPTGANFTDDMAEFAKELENAGEYGEVFKKVYQSWRNIDAKMTEITARLNTSILKKGKNLPEAQVDEITQDIELVMQHIAHTPMPKVGAVLQEVLKTRNWLDGNNLTTADKVRNWTKSVYVADEEGKIEDVFNLSKLYPHVDINELSFQDFRKLMWGAYAEFASHTYRTSNTGKYSMIFKKLEEIAKKLGLTLDDLAGSIKGGGNPFEQLDAMKRESDKVSEVASWMRFKRQMERFNFTKADGTPILLKDTVGDFSKYFPEWKGNKKRIVSSLKASGIDIPYEEITLEMAVKEIGRKIYAVAPHAEGEPITEARVLYQTRENFMADIKQWSDNVVKEWGATKQSPKFQSELDALRDVKKALTPKLDYVKGRSAAIAASARNFAFHDYNKSHFDDFLTVFLGNSFHYWTTRTYVKMVDNLVDRPGLANAYLSYKEYMEKEHAKDPEWMRYMTKIGSLPGIDLENPYFVNIESMINPMYGITGVDFNDPYKRVDWVSRMVDDMGKQGPSFSPLISWAVAMHLFSKGEEEAGQRWMGRLFSFSPQVKSATSSADDILGKFGINVDTKPVEIDPFVRFLDKGVDPYERNRIAAAFGLMVNNKMTINGQVITQEMAIEASQLGEGELWDMSTEISADDRFAGDMSSFFLGAGARPRTEFDKEVSRFWGEYHVLLSSRSLMSPNDYRIAWDNMRDKYNFMDTLLVSRKAGDDGDRAYAYNVLGRIPPGQMNDVAAAANINPILVQQFYDNKGDFKEMNMAPQDRAAFMAGIVNIGAILKIPPGATRQEWSQAKTVYSAMRDLLQQEYGADIHEKVAHFYELPEAQREDFLEQHPEVSEALDRQTELIANVPVLLDYYGSLETIQRYANNEERKRLEALYGENIYDTYYTYLDIIDEKKRKQFKAEHPELSGFIKDKNDGKDFVNQRVVDLARLMPEGEEPLIREGDKTEVQQELIDIISEPEGIDPNELLAEMTPELQQLVQAYWADGTPLRYSAREQLKFVGSKYGLSADEVLQILGQ